MFTGIVTEIGRVTAVVRRGDAAVLKIAAPATAAGVRLGESVAVAGVCLTVTEVDAHGFAADVMRETLRASRLGDLAPESRVNLERPVPVGGRLDGHIVQGHVDAVARLVSRTGGEAWEDLEFEADAGLARYLAVKGSVAIDGVSLTVTSVHDGDPARLGVSLIPTTLAATTLGGLGVGDRVNVEVDILAKYVERLLGADASSQPRGRA